MLGLRAEANLLTCRWVRTTAGPERRDACEVVSVRIRHAAVRFNWRQPGIGPSGNIPLLICCGEMLSCYTRGRPLEPGHARAHARACAHTRAQSHAGIPSRYQRKRDTTGACRQTGALTRIARKTTGGHVHVDTYSSKGTRSRPNMLIKSTHLFSPPFKDSALKNLLQLETFLNTVNTFLELIAC